MAGEMHQVHRDQAGAPITRVKLGKHGGAVTDIAKATIIATIRGGELVETASPGRVGAALR